MKREGIGYFARFGVTERMIHETLAAALSRGGEHADVSFQHRVASDIGLEDGAVNRAHASVELGVGVRVVKGDQTGYGYTEDLALPSLVECARTAATIADGPGRDSPGAPHVGGGLPDRYPLVRPWEDVRPEEKLPILSALNARAFAADPRVRKVTVYLRDESGAILMADSSGRMVEDRQPMTLLFLSLLAEDGGRREQNGYNVAGRAGFEFYTPDRLDRVVREAVERTTVLFEASPPPAGEMPVVLAAGSSGILLHEAIGHGMEADFNRKGVSIYADKIGKRIAQPFVNIVDDAANPGARGAINVDDEGNAAGTTHLVVDGVSWRVLLEELRDAVLELRTAGTTVIFSTHDMSVAEQLCDFIFMIFKGRKVLDGTLTEIQDRYGSDTIRIRMPAVNGDLAHLQGIARVNEYGPYKELRMSPGADPQKILRQLMALGSLEHFEIARPSLHDIFVRIARPELEEMKESARA